MIESQIRSKIQKEIIVGGYTNAGGNMIELIEVKGEEGEEFRERDGTWI